jgi:SAM-dependent methyltransferase
MSSRAYTHAMVTKTYCGDELSVFALARNWKEYYREHIAAYIRGDVLEVGAGIGGTTRVLCSGDERSWLCLEPDPDLATELRGAVERDPPRLLPTVRVGCVSDLDHSQLFDCVLYIDVLEHIEDDRTELANAAQHLRPGGTLVVLCPAHDFLFSKFDGMIGHHRRYNKRMLRAIAPPGLRSIKIMYLDAIGMLLSLGNRYVLRSGAPTDSQVKFWDRVVIPCSTWLDPLFAYRVGKTIIAVWENAGARTPAEVPLPRDHGEAKSSGTS